MVVDVNAKIVSRVPKVKNPLSSSVDYWIS